MTWFEKKDMDNVSILDQIIDNKKAEEVNNLDAVEIINSLFAKLTDRERDVLIRRYGLHSGKKETLESIGQAHELTRERIRQIETSSIKKLQNLKSLNAHVDNLKKVVSQLLEEHSGMMEKEYLLNSLASFSSGGFRNKNHDEMVHKNYLNFLITKLLHGEFEEINSSKHFKPAYKLKYRDIKHLEEIAEELVGIIYEVKEIFETEELIGKAQKIDSYHKNKEKLTGENVIDISSVLKNDFFEEDPDTINSNKPIYSILKAMKRVEQNRFGHWGVHNSREIKPKTINDKIYLILKNNEKPMHFAEIADYINKISFDHKIANAATVHNELILDSKYVLVGRGLYGLKEWGFKKGTVTDVISDILNQVGKPISRNEIINKVLEKRVVKKATIILALMNRDRFVRIDGGYTVKV